MTTLRERQLSEFIKIEVPQVQCFEVFRSVVFICVLTNYRCIEANAQLESASYEECGQWTNLESVNLRQSWPRYYFSASVHQSTQRNGCNSSCVSSFHLWIYFLLTLILVYNVFHTMVSYNIQPEYNPNKMIHNISEHYVLLPHYLLVFIPFPTKRSDPI